MWDLNSIQKILCHPSAYLNQAVKEDWLYSYYQHKIKYILLRTNKWQQVQRPRK